MSTDGRRGCSAISSTRGSYGPPVRARATGSTDLQSFGGCARCVSSCTASTSGSARSARTAPATRVRAAPGARRLALLCSREANPPATGQSRRSHDTDCHPPHRDPNGHADFKVADLSLAELGRKEITLAEHEMPGLMATRAEYAAGAAAAGRAHHRLAAHDRADGRADRDAHGARRGGALVQLQHLLHPGPRRRGGRGRPRRHARRSPAGCRCTPGRARRWRSTGGAPSRRCAGRARTERRGIRSPEGGVADRT